MANFTKFPNSKTCTQTGAVVIILTIVVTFQLICYSHLPPQQYSPGDKALIENLNILLSSIEELYETGKFNGPEERFFAIVEKTASVRPVSVLLLKAGLHSTSRWADSIGARIVRVFLRATKGRFLK